MANVYLTGASGFIGSRVANLLLQKGYSVTAALRSTSSLARVPSGCSIVRVDFLDPESIEPHLEGTRAIYHIAGTTKAASQEEFDRGNAATTRALLKAREAVSPDALFILASSQAAAGPGDRGPVSPYGASKLLAETIARRTDGWVVVRPPAVFGPDDPATEPIIRLANKGLFFSPWVNTGGFCLVYVDDLARLFGMLPDCPDMVGQTLLPAYDHPISWKEFYAAIRRAAGRKVLHVRLPVALVPGIGYLCEYAAALRGRCAAFDRYKARDFVCCDWKLDDGRTRNITGWKTETGLVEALERTFSWFRSRNG
ncbi:NAD-dependent epimerase/dehydratase family protein [Candidatus Fermentibacteria bacterium]|nr:NAD-dependent epimerase/dehydratase family protein [Candidatus Fermentibacteria bacterium]